MATDAIRDVFFSITAYQTCHRNGQFRIISTINLGLIISLHGQRSSVDGQSSIFNNKNNILKSAIFVTELTGLQPHGVRTDICSVDIATAAEDKLAWIEQRAGACSNITVGRLLRAIVGVCCLVTCDVDIKNRMQGGHIVAVETIGAIRVGICVFRI